MDSQLLAGTLEMLLLQVIAPAPAYGYRITQEVMARSQGYFDLKEGSLYPALHRMEREGLLKSHWEEVGPKRRRKYYRVTAKGLAALEKKEAEWRKFSVAVNGILGTPSNAVA